MAASPVGWWSVSSTEIVRSLSLSLSLSPLLSAWMVLLLSLSVETLPSLLLSVSNR